jgi:TPR repeat protein
MKGMDFLAQYYYATGVAIAGGINPAANHAPLPSALQHQAEGRFALARQWFDRSAAKGDLYAAGQLAIMLDSGLGGPRDSVRAEQLRARVKAGPDADFAKRATQDPGNLAMTAAWQSGHYGDALQAAQARAAKGDANAEALLGRAYYEGVGVARNYATALAWLNKATAQKNADALFFLGLMYEWGHGVKQDVDKAQAPLDEAAGLGQGYAKIEAAGMRMEGAAAAQQAKFAAVCHNAGGVADGPLCLVGGAAIDPY